MTGENWILTYYQMIQNGSVIVGKWVRLVYEYIVHGLESKEFFYDSKKANKAIKFIESYCRHTEGPLAPGLIKLEVWQKALVSGIYGIVNENGLRQFHEILLVVARKNGKSLFASALMNYEFFVDGGYGARIYNIAPKLDQAEIIYNNVWQTIKMDPELNSLARHRMTDLFLESTNSTVKKIAFSAKKSDGFNPSLVVCDEIASWAGDKGLKQYEVLKSGMGARPEPLLISCTTSGYENEGIYDELMKRATRLLNGDSREKHLLPMIYQIDDLDKWDDINELRKSNPNLGVSVSTDYLLDEIAVAEGSLSKKAEFLTKYCNIKQSSSQAWLPAQAITDCSGDELHIEDFAHCYCVGGIDLSQSIDLTSACVVIEKNKKLYVFSHFWLPHKKLEEATIRDNLPYSAYIDRGILTLSGDSHVNYKDCFDWFVHLVEDYEILPLQIGYDRYESQYLVQDLDAYGFHTDDVNQGFNLTPVLQEMEGLVKDGVLRIGNNDLLKIHLLDSAIMRDNLSRRIRLVKIQPQCHIDGTAALSDALCVRQKYYSEIGLTLANESEDEETGEKNGSV